jgi:hypothetical protein
MSEDETRLRKSYSQQNEEESNMDIKTVFTEVWHAGWTFTKAMAMSFGTLRPVGYFDPLVNTRVASQLIAAGEADRSAFQWEGVPREFEDKVLQFNPATGLLIPGGSGIDVGGNPDGWNNDWNDVWNNHRDNS